MKILLVNDDGISSSNLWIAKDILSKFGEVTVVAPCSEQSAKSMSFTYGGTTFEKQDEYTYCVNGTPVDCTTFALLCLRVNPDFVVSGVNNGYNIGIDTRYSGTVGAALQAQFFKYPSVAISADYGRDIMIHKELENVINYILDNNLLSDKYTLNVNLPRDKFIKSNGILESKVYPLMHKYEEEIDLLKYAPNRKYFWVDNIPSDSEQYCYLNGYSSISKIKL